MNRIAPSLTQAVLEGVAFAFRDSLEALKAAGTTLTRVTAIGGGSRSRYWLKSIATALGIPVDLPADGDFGAAFGAARLGLIAAENADPLDGLHGAGDGRDHRSRPQARRRLCGCLSALPRALSGDQGASAA